MVKNLPANAGDTRDMGSIPGSGRSPGVGNGNPLQNLCLKNLLDRRAWWATVHGVSKSQRRQVTGHAFHMLQCTDPNLHFIFFPNLHFKEF